MAPCRAHYRIRDPACGAVQLLCVYRLRKTAFCIRPLQWVSNSIVPLQTPESRSSCIFAQSTPTQHLSVTQSRPQNQNQNMRSRYTVLISGSRIEFCSAYSPTPFKLPLYSTFCVYSTCSRYSYTKKTMSASDDTAQLVLDKRKTEFKQTVTKEQSRSVRVNGVQLNTFSLRTFPEVLLPI